MGPKGPTFSTQIVQPMQTTIQNKTIKYSSSKKIQPPPILFDKIKQKANLISPIPKFPSPLNRKKAVSNGHLIRNLKFQNQESVSHLKWVPHPHQRQPALAVQLSTPKKKKKKNHHPSHRSLFPKF